LFSAKGLKSNLADRAAVSKGEKMKTVWIIVGVIVVLFVLLALGFAGSGMMGYGWGRGMMGDYGTRGFGMMFPFWCLAGPLFWILVVGGIVWLVVTQLQKGGGATGGSPRETPLDILKARYAKGELTKEQFEEMKKDIGA
jgi:putative membrane protein